VLPSLAAVGMVMVANFLLIPNFATYWQFNFNYPREHLGVLYLVGGLVSFATMQLVGRLVDRFGATLVATIGTVFFIGCLFVSFVRPQYSWSALALFVAFMGTSSFRFIPLQSLSSRVPPPAERARYMSAQSAVQHIASAAGALLASHMLTELPGGRLVGMDRVGLLAMALGSVVPLLLWVVESQVRAREGAVAASARM
jgi:predicted MFS family arabinose efflux permease